MLASSTPKVGVADSGHLANVKVEYSCAETAARTSTSCASDFPKTSSTSQSTDNFTGSRYKATQGETDSAVRWKRSMLKVRLYFQRSPL